MKRPSRKKRLLRSTVYGIDTEAQDNKTVCIVAAADGGERRVLRSDTGLSSYAMLHWLVNLPKGLKVAFAWNYDVTMILRDFPFETLDKLRRYGVVGFDRWKIRHIPGKRFWVKDRVSGKTCQIWDVWTWYPYSFNRLLEKWDLASEEEAKFIRRMKSVRDKFDTLGLDEIVDYCALECRLLSRWTNNILRLHRESGLSLRSYCGPGSSASAIFRANGWKPPARDEELLEVAGTAFYGGRNETSCIGVADGPIYSYDIGSAYPYEISKLPEIVGWRKRKGPPPDLETFWGFAEVEWVVPEGTVWGPFPVRGAILKTGRALSLVYPLEGRGVYHSSEIKAALSVFPNSIRIRRTWEAETTGAEPLAWVRDLAARRLKLKAEGNPLAYPLKVGLNALYGKMVQRKGKAPYRDIVYGAAITAETRARIFRILSALGHDALLSATDGILSRQEFSDLDFGSNLGQWEREVFPDAFIAQSGVYWVGEKIRTRGFRRRSLNRAEIQREWMRHGLRAEVEYDERRFIGYRAATARGRPDLIGVWKESVRHLRLNPFPRRKPGEDGKLMTTYPPSQTEWQIRMLVDEIMLDNAGSKIYESVSTIEDPEWNSDTSV